MTGGRLGDPEIARLFLSLITEQKSNKKKYPSEEVRSDACL